MGSPVFRSEQDWVGVLEAAHRPTTDDTTWANEVVSAAARLFDASHMIGVASVRYDAALAFTPAFLSGWRLEPEELLGRLAAFAQASPATFRALYFPPRMVTTHGALDRMVSDDERAVLGAIRAGFGIEDALGLVLHPSPGVASVLSIGWSGAIEVTRAEHHRLTQLAIHLEAAQRLRLHPESVIAVIHPDGRIAHAEGRAAPELGALALHAKNADRAKTRAWRDKPEALDLWRAVVAGRVSLVEREDGGKRLWLAVENDPAKTSMRALSPAQLAALQAAARGLSTKEIAYTLGVSVPTASAHLGEAASRVGVATRIDLVRIAALLAHDPRAAFADVDLTEAERDILELVQRGLSNAEIASQRSRSVRTIANQIAGLLRKTGSPGRQALAARVSKSPVSPRR